MTQDLSHNPLEWSRSTKYFWGQDSNPSSLQTSHVTLLVHSLLMPIGDGNCDSWILQLCFLLGCWTSLDVFLFAKMCQDLSNNPIESLSTGIQGQAGCHFIPATPEELYLYFFSLLASSSKEVKLWSQSIWITFQLPHFVAVCLWAPVSSPANGDDIATFS